MPSVVAQLIGSVQQHWTMRLYNTSEDKQAICAAVAFVHFQVGQLSLAMGSPGAAQLLRPVVGERVVLEDA